MPRRRSVVVPITSASAEPTPERALEVYKEARARADAACFDACAQARTVYETARYAYMQTCTQAREARRKAYADARMVHDKMLRQLAHAQKDALRALRASRPSGKDLRAARQVTGTLLPEAAYNAYTTQIYLSSIERGVNVPSDELVRRLCRLYVESATVARNSGDPSQLAQLPPSVIAFATTELSA